MSAEDRVHDVYRSSFDQETQLQESKLSQFVKHNPLVPICKEHSPALSSLESRENRGNEGRTNKQTNEEEE